jgi:hypothetical protein
VLSDGLVAVSVFNEARGGMQRNTGRARIGGINTYSVRQTLRSRRSARRRPRPSASSPRRSRVAESRPSHLARRSSVRSTQRRLPRPEVSMNRTIVRPAALVLAAAPPSAVLRRPRWRSRAGFCRISPALRKQDRPSYRST